MSVRRIRLDRPDAVTWIVLALVALALVLRLYDLGARALHHDESLHATYSWYFAVNRQVGNCVAAYCHDPLMHGPFQFHFTAAMFKLFGDGDFMSRMPAALTGTALVATPLLLRRWLGPVGTVAAALFLTLSPTLLYYSRFAREDIYVWLWTVLLFVSVWRYLDDGRDRWLGIAAASLALSFATKESVYLSIAILLLYLDVRLTIELLDQRGTKGEERWLEGIFLAPIAWLIVAFWHPLESWRASRGFTTLPRSADILIVIGILSLPQLSAAVQLPLKAMGVDVSGDAERQIGIITVCALLGGATIVGLLWDWQRWVLVAAIFYAITIPLFTTEFLNTRDGLASDFWGALDYWMAQQEVQRGTQPWFYYLMMVPLYEFLTLIPAFIGGIWLIVKRRDGLAILIAWWFVGSLVAFSYAGEKMPWLTSHMAVPLAFLAAYVCGRFLPVIVTRLRDLDRSSSATWAVAAVAGFAFLLAFGLSVRNAHAVSFLHPDTPVEPLIYTQTSRDVPNLSRDIHRLAAEAPPGQLSIFVDSSEGATWPWAWYLRHLNVAYADPAYIQQYATPKTVILALPGTLSSIPQLREQAGEVRPYHHRWAFPEDGYKGTTWSNFLTRLANGRLFAQWSEFFQDRIPESWVLGWSLDGIALIPSLDTLNQDTD
ncbi:MAG: TIGR03663 family protein [Dehalococcoidia bacterium]|nr:TIGR03663 family protein [Dehalococcoidia bacterium]